MRPLALLPALAALACSQETPEPAQSARAAQVPAWRPVVAEALDRLQRELALGATTPPPVPEDIDERCAGLLATVASARDGLREIALEELAGLGDAVVPALSRELASRQAPRAIREAAAQALARVDTPAAAEALLAALESSRGAEPPEPWLYARCALALGATSQDQVVPRLVLCLKYESDHETAVAIADSLSRRGNLAGLEALFVVAREGQGAELRARASEVLDRLRQDLGCAEWSEIERAWREGDGSRLPPPPRSPRYQLAVWRWIAELGAWQLRGVDDARFVLARLGGDDSRALSEALSDESLYVRVHAAQCLERMGPRGRAAGPALVLALEDPALAPQAAAALGALRFAPAEAVLRTRLSGASPLDLRVAAARALGRIEPAELEGVLRPLLAPDEPPDLRAAAAEAIVAAAPAAAAPASLAEPLRLLAGWLTSGEVEPSGPEAVLEGWLERRAQTGDALAHATLEAWRAVAPEPERSRLAARAELLRSRLAALGA